MIFISKVKSKITYRHLLYFFALNVMWPSVFSFMGWLPEFKTGVIILFGICLIVAFSQGAGQLPSAIKNIIIVQMVTFVLYSLLHSDSSYLTRCFYLAITTMLLIVQARRPKMEFVDTFIVWLTIQAVMGAVGFVLVYIGVLHAFSTFREFDGHMGQFYGLFTTTVDLLSSGVLRVAGFFDEPGAFACWGVMALLYNKLFIDNKRIEKLLIVGLISTLSLAYFIQIAMYFYFFYRKRMGKLLTYGIAFVTILMIVASVSPEINDAIFGRFQYNAETGTFQGDNRSSLSAVCKGIWLTSPIFGVGARGLIDIGQQMGRFVGANPFVFFASDGIIGQIILWLPLFCLFSFRKQNSMFMSAAIIIFAGFLQRPYDPTQLMYPLVIMTMCMEGYRQQYLDPSERSDFDVNLEDEYAK